MGYLFFTQAFFGTKVYAGSTLLKEDYELLGVRPGEYDYSLIDSSGWEFLAYGPIFLGGFAISYKLIHSFLSEFPSKIQYNNSRDLIFVDTVSLTLGTKTNIYEMAHLERDFPFLKSQTKRMNFGPTGITTINNLNRPEINLRVMNADKKWKEGEREEFYKRVTRMMDENYANEGFYHKYE